jgi:hypothetical protein
VAPHTGQSSQLFLDANHRSAEFLPTVARSALNSASHSESRALARKGLTSAACNREAHSGQSSQLVLDSYDRNAQFLPTVDECHNKARVKLVLLTFGEQRRRVS